MEAHELYGLGGHDPDHPSGNVIGAFVREPDGPWRVRHFDDQGTVTEDRELTDEEISLFDLDGTGPAGG